MLKRIIRLLEKQDFRQNPAKALYRRLYWRARWKLFAHKPFIVPFYGGQRIRLAPSSASSGIFLNNGFSDGSIATEFIKYLKPGMVAIDCGAHIGEYTLLFAYLVGERGEVHAFEPDPRVFPYLDENVRMNNLLNVFVNKLALAECEKEISFILEDDPTASHIIREGMNWKKSGQLVNVKGISLDAYARERGLRRIDAIKIDVEGAELAVLEGAVESLQKFQPGLIFVEVEGGDADKVEKFLSRLGFSVRWHSEGHRFPHIWAYKGVGDV